MGRIWSRDRGKESSNWRARIGLCIRREFPLADYNCIH